ncbi:MAG TPA: ABC transporter permease, partial [Gemmatimonadaceae bacterium]|nr:ABC transporter permease [Gemmatimonadaceae bacterium]
MASPPRLAERILRDAKYAARRLTHAPVFAIAVIITLALGIGANTAILQLIDSFYLRKLPVPAPERIVAIYTIDPRLRGTNRLAGNEWSSAETFRQLQRVNLRAVSNLAAYTMVSVQGSGDLGADPTWAAMVLGSYFETLGVRPQRGRFIRADEAESDDAAVVVISDRIWHDRFRADERVLGRTIQIGAGTFTIVGVAPPAFTGIHPEGRTDLWINGARLAAATGASSSIAPKQPNVLIFGRLAAGSTVAALQAACDNFVRDLATSRPGTHEHFGLLARVRDRLTSYEASPNAVHTFIVLWIMVALLHLAACTNVASLMMARESSRRRETGVRLCLGASRGDILRLCLLEAAILAVFGGVGGVIVAHWIAGMIGRMQFLSASIWVLDFRIAALVAVVSGLTVLQFGLAPAIGTASTDPLAIVRGSPAGGRRNRDRSELIVVVQVAISVALLSNAAAFVGLFRRQVDANPGYDASHVALVHFAEPGRVGPRTDRDGRYVELLQHAASIPGVRAVAAAVGGPLFDTRWFGELKVTG